MNKREKTILIWLVLMLVLLVLCVPAMGQAEETGSAASNWQVSASIAGLILAIVATGAVIYGFGFKMAKLTTMVEELWSFHKISTMTLWKNYIEQGVKSFTNPSPRSSHISKPDDLLQKDNVRSILATDELSEQKVIRIVSEVGWEELKLITEEKDPQRIVAKISLFVKDQSSSLSKNTGK